MSAASFVGLLSVGDLSVGDVGPALIPIDARKEEDRNRDSCDADGFLVCDGADCSLAFLGLSLSSASFFTEASSFPELSFAAAGLDAEPAFSPSSFFAGAF